MESLKIYKSSSIGEVEVTEDVIAIIAGIAATEVEGVHSMVGNITNELIAKLGRQNLSAGVNVTCIENIVSVKLAITVQLGYKISEVSMLVQEKVKNAIESMTGLIVESVDVRIANVNIDNWLWKNL